MTVFVNLPKSTSIEEILSDILADLVKPIDKRKMEKSLSDELDLQYKEDLIRRVTILQTTAKDLVEKIQEVKTDNQRLQEKANTLSDYVNKITAKI